MKSKLKALLKNRLRSVGMDANDTQMTRLLDHVVEKTGVEDFLKKMSANEVFNTCQEEKKTNAA